MPPGRGLSADELAPPGPKAGAELATLLGKALSRRALRRMPEMIDDVPQLPVPQACPVTLAELPREAADG